MGSSSSKTSSSNSTTDNTFNNVDNRVGGGDGGIIGGNVNLNAADSTVGDVSIVNTDYGAVQSGIGAALAALEAGGEGLSETLDFVTDSNKLANDQVLQAVNKSFTLAGESTRSETASALKDFMKWSAVIVIGSGIVYAIIKKI